MPIGNSVQNQLGAPAIWESVLASFPPAGYTGRLLVATDTFAWYRDNGTGFDLIGGPGSGTITGSGTSGSLPLFVGSAVIGDSALTQSGGDLISSGTFTAASLIKTGGTSNEFLKADGSVDSNTYLTASSLTGYVPYIGATSGVVLGNNQLSISKTDATVALQISQAGSGNLLNLIGSSGGSFIIDNNANIVTNGSYTGFDISGTTGSFSGGLIARAPANQTYILEGRKSSSSVIIAGLYQDAFSGGQLLLNDNTGFSNIVLNGTTGSIVSLNNTSSALLLGTNTNPGTYQFYMTGTFGCSGLVTLGNSIDVTGTGSFSSTLTASSLIKLGGTSTQSLIADGSTMYQDGTTYLPAINTTNSVNITSVNAVQNFVYIRNKDSLTIQGRFSITTTAPGASSILIPLPFSPSALSECPGVGVNQYYEIARLSYNNIYAAVQMTFTTAVAGPMEFCVTFGFSL